MRPGLFVEAEQLPWLYLIVESDTGWVRYVGRTISPVQRMAGHRNGALRDLHEKLRKRGAQMSMILLRQLEAGEDPDEAEQAELNKRAHLDGLLNRRSPSRAHAAQPIRRPHPPQDAARGANGNG